MELCTSLGSKSNMLHFGIAQFYDHKYIQNVRCAESSIECNDCLSVQISRQMAHVLDRLHRLNCVLPQHDNTCFEVSRSIPLIKNRVSRTVS